MKRIDVAFWVGIAIIIALLASVAYMGSGELADSGFLSKKITDISVYEFFIMMWLVLFLNRPSKKES